MPKVAQEQTLSVKTATRLLREAKSVYRECRDKGNMRDSVTALLRVTEAERDLVAAKKAEAAASETTENLSPAEAGDQLLDLLMASPRKIQAEAYRRLRELPGFGSDDE